MRHMSYNESMVSRVDLHKGRVAQKNRTRRALIKAAWELLSEGVQPTVEEVAQTAEISRATAYRYFPNRERLLIEAILSRENRTPQEILSREAGKQLADRVARVHTYIYDQVMKNETLYRSLVRCSIDEWIKNRDRMVLRADERFELLEEALRPVMDKEFGKDLENLTYALVAMVGIESYIALRDVCQLSKIRSKEVMSWAIKTLVSAVAKGEEGE
jgi:AcrR family transcriptional regulator